MCEKKAGRWGFHPNLLEIMEAVMEQRRNGAAPYLCSLPGSYIWKEQNVSCFRDASGTIVQLLAFGIDVHMMTLLVLRFFGSNF